MPLFCEITLGIIIALIFLPLWVFYFMALKAHADSEFREALVGRLVVIRFTASRGIFFQDGQRLVRFAEAAAAKVHIIQHGNGISLEDAVS